ncbi:MAG: PAS domain-containing protein [Calditrichaeota bacterium]|nr:MAG: PAS domain-containing protein [Calditrichota bacterium]
MAHAQSKNLSPLHAAIVLDSIAEGVLTVDQNRVITYFNRAAERITGVPRKEAIGQYCFEVLRTNICEKACALHQTFATGQEGMEQTVNILRADGRQIPISLSASQLRNETGEVVGGVETFRDLSTIEALKKEIHRTYTFEDIISKNHRILEILDILPNIAESESTVLIQGPSGSGKELFARAIHNLSPRRKGPFVAINCGALPDTLLESELFGYMKGAFTDARKDKPGRFALAEGGTIFLDEVESLSPATQVKLLRVLQEREYEPLGATAPMKADVRVVAATKEDLAALVKKGSFRDDLYFRLNVVKLQLPRLVERRDDIPMLVNHFIEKFNHKMGRHIVRISDEALSILMHYDFPGNIRELENIVEHAFVMCSGETIEPQHLPPELLRHPSGKQDRRADSTPLQSAERQALLEALQKHNWNKLQTARALGIHRTSLWRKLKKHGLA